MNRIPTLDGWRGIAVVLVLVALCFAAIHALRSTPAFPLDDGYITLHSAQSLHAGFDRNYPGVSPLYGATSAPFLGLVYLLLFPLPPLIALDVACWLGVLCYCLGLLQISRAMRLSTRDSALLCLLGLTASYVPYHVLNGLETSWALAGVAWTLALASGSSRWWPWAAAAAGTTASIRPDLLPFAVIVVLTLAAKQYRRSGLSWHVVLLFAVSLLPIALCAAWYLHATGVPFPETGVAKQAFFAETGLPWMDKTLTESTSFLAFLFSAGFLCMACRQLFRSTLGRGMALFAGIFCLSIYLQIPGAMGWNRSRYPVILIPILIWALADQLRIDHRARRILHLSLIYSLAFAIVAINLYVRDCRRYGGGLREVASWCTRNLPTGSTLLVHDAGYIAYATPFRITDMVGLKTPEAISLNRAITLPSVGEQRSVAVSDLARDRGADYLIVLDGWPPTLDLVSEMRGLKWKVEPLHTEGIYHVFRLSAP
jgi:hypothetical protein